MCLYDQMEVVEEAIWEDSLTATPAGVSFDVDNSILSVYGSEQPTIYRFFMLPGIFLYISYSTQQHAGW